MIEIVVGLVVIAQTGLIWYLLNSQKEERSKLINAVVSKNAQEMTTLEILDKQKPEKKRKDEEVLTPVENLSDEDFNKFVLNK